MPKPVPSPVPPFALPPFPALPGPEATSALILAARDHLVRLVQPSGRFTYAHPLDRPDQPLPGYNELRHCGTLWFMLRACGEIDASPASPDLAAAISRAADHAVGLIRRPDWAGEGRMVLVAEGAIKLGGIGLALCAFAELAGFTARERLGTPAEAEALQGVLRGLSSYALDQIEGEDFRHKRATSGAPERFRSDYYTGEAILGLLLAGCAAPELARVTRALMARRYGWAEQSHWMAYAAAEALERGLTPEGETRDYLAGLGATILLDPAYRARRASTLIACRAEALSRILILAARRPGLFAQGMYDAFRAHLETDLSLLLGWYRHGQFARGDGSDRVQIDYVQHNATAFLNWHLARPAAPRHGR